MRATGIVRKVDELGRIVLPIELRRKLDIAERDPVEIFVDGESIVLHKFEQSCVFCGQTVGLEEHHGKLVCASCRYELKRCSPR